MPAANLVGELNGSFRQVMRQMEHERGGIDRLVSNRRLYEDVRPLADTADPLVRQEIAAIESGYRIGRLLVLRETLGQGPPAVLGGDQDVLHRARAAHRRRSAAGCSGPGRCSPSRGLGHRVSRNICYAPGYTIMGGTTPDPAQHPGRAHARASPASRDPALSRDRQSRRTGGSGSRSTGATRTGRRRWRRRGRTPAPG